jgi:soluble lytic murein transglycosylase-like protein
MASGGLAARAKFFLLLPILSAWAPACGSGAEPGALSVTADPDSVTVELPTPPATGPAHRPAVVTADPAPGEQAVAPDASAPVEPAPTPAAPPSAVPPPPPAPAPPVPPASPLAPVPPAMPADRMVPLERAAMKPILLEAAAESGLPSDLVLAQAWAESSWQGSVVSSAEAVGVLQITPPTVDFVSRQLLRLDHLLDPLSPADNARMGTRYMRHLLSRTDNNLRQALIAYNQGLGALRRNGPYAEAQRYADRVIALRPLFVAGG